MIIAYATNHSAQDRHAWSGLVFYIQKALRDAGATVVPVDGLQYPFPRLFRFKTRLYRRVLGRKYLPDRQPLILRSWAAQVAQRLNSVPCDVIFSPSSLPIAYLKVKKPAAFWTDSTFGGLHDVYDWFSNLCPETVRDGHRAEQRALSRTNLAIYTSDWARQSAAGLYQVASSKLEVVPFGANVEHALDEAEVRELVRHRARRETVKLLFIGVEWERKGGDVAVAAAAELKRRGVSVELDVVGCTPRVSLPSFVRVHGFVSKRTPEGRQILDHLFREAAFFILPSRAECYGLVLAEANSYGVPCLTTDVGGIPTIIIEGKNGFLLPVDAHPHRYSELVASHQNPVSYTRLGDESFRQYTGRLNWKTAASRVLSLLERHIGQS